MAKTNVDAVFKVKINMENDEIELLEEKKYDIDEGNYYEINEIEEKNCTPVQLFIMEDDNDELEKEGEDVEKCNEIIEHVCGKCFSTYSNLNRLKKHLKYCRTQTKIDNTEEKNEFIAEMENNISTIEEDAVKMEMNKICFCCEENFETCHSGHIRCFECPKSFKNERSFERHVFLIHSGSENFPCNVCNARCPTEKVLELHQKSHNRGKPFACKKCGKEFTRRYHLYRHQQFSTCDNEAPKEEIFCKVCRKVFYRVDNLRSHLRQHLGDKVKNRDYQCPYCEKSFYGTATLNIHIRSHTGERPFTCDLCDKGFPSNAALRKHRRSHTGEKPFSCSRCPKAFAAKEVLNRHMKTHTGERPHSCEKCGKSFIQATQLKNHNETHHKSDPVKCTLCDKEFRSNLKFQRHMKNTHSNGGEPHKCDICSEYFKTSAGLKRHTSRMHKQVEFTCTICPEKFSVKQDLDFHILLHDDQDQHSQSSNKGNENEEQEQDVETIELGSIKAEDLDKQVKIEEYVLEEEDNIKIQGKEEYKSDCDSGDVSDSEESQHTLMEIVDLENVEFIMDEEVLRSNVQKLLDILLDKDILLKFGWPTADVEYVLQEVIKNCGHTTKMFDNITDTPTKLREYVKLLFTVVIDNDSIKELLNNHSIDDVIKQVLKMANNN